MGFISINNAEGYTSHSSLVLSTQAQGGIAAAINTVVYSKLNDIHTQTAFFMISRF